MSKEFELIRLEGGYGQCKAIMYNRLCGYYKEVVFMNYSKREIYKKLRTEYNCIVRCKK